MARNAARSTATLAQALRDAGVSQRAAGAALGHSDAYVNRRLNGSVGIDLDDLEALAALAGLAVVVELVPVTAGEA